jgi:hypothetical protein
VHAPARLMKTERTFTHEKCLSSDVVSIAFIYFLNLAHPSLKYGIQFLLIQSPQNLLRTVKKLVLVSQLNSFGSFFDYKKQL